jgi:hypothetical protein
VVAVAMLACTNPPASSDPFIMPSALRHTTVHQKGLQQNNKERNGDQRGRVGRSPTHHIAAPRQRKLLKNWSTRNPLGQHDADGIEVCQKACICPI